MNPVQFFGLLLLAVGLCACQSTSPSVGSDPSVCVGAACADSPPLAALNPVGSQQASEPTSGEPSGEPAGEPGIEPAAEPGAEPSVEPAPQPSSEPSTQPSSEPAGAPTAEPSEPAGAPTAEPSEPAVAPAAEPGAEPQAEPEAMGEITTCVNLIECLDACDQNDEDCIELCLMVSSAEATSALTTFLDCSATHCANLPEEESGPCLATFCLEELAPCVLDGEGSCSELSGCITTCGDDSDCVQFCFSVASPEAYIDFVTLSQCTQGFCAQEEASDSCGIAAHLACSAQANACGLTQGAGTCGELVDCMFECFSGECLLSCYGEAAEDAAILASEYMTCVFGECGASLDKECWENAESGPCFLPFSECAQ